MTETITRFSLCCAKHIRSVWEKIPPETSENVIMCPECRKLIGLGSVKKEEANKFLKAFELEEI